MAEQVLVDVAEAARRLGLGRSTVYELIGRGELESIVIGRSRRVPVKALEDFVEVQRREQIPASR